ncbi:penicillin-insensitive murein endopeptidase [Halovulum dunhuangense]|uniref:Penicillin-insensitive murein endopeptidase n=1 Tax=Halovulum dunhuangense TaxID=1505036 RepID=A0A849L5C8_9RHOB|nr:penicillin-insensitive murein endopeptidase [Halovulum dunhuangense]NNU81585.1 penicillin-insensitive murein endopeptidase [Halovulum dunhuangense]
MIRSLLASLAFCAALAYPAGAQTPAKQLFGAAATPSEHAPAPFGSYSAGCLAGAVELPETGPSWQAMRLSRNRNWGHPETIRFVQRLSIAAQRIGWNGIYVGDISQPRGGPMLTGHASHQMGLDMDIWMLPPDRLDLTRAERERISSIDVRTPDQRNVNGNWTDSHHRLLRAAASDPAVARIFVTPPVKLRMCADETGDRAYLRKIRPWWGHNTHFHVRLNCPAGAAGCVEQDPIPPGDGCADAVWWVTEALEPAKPDPNAPPPEPRRDLTLADLPQQCAAILR